MNLGARWIDVAVIVAYLAAITWFGAQFRSSQHTLRDYFLGGKTAPWWAIALSIVSAETSTLTVIGTPPLAFRGNYAFLQLVFGYLLGRLIIVTFFLPAYFRGEMYTAYELMRVRFGERIRRLTAAAFLVLRALAEGVRVFAVSIVISIVLGAGETASIAVILCLTLFYTYEGGLTAVIWTDVIQMALYVAGAIVSLVLLLHQIPGGWGHVAAVAGPLGKLQVFDFRLAAPAEFFARTYSFWAGILGGCFLTTASHGTDQLIVQRLLAARNCGQSQAALLASWVVIFVQFALFLAIGTCLFVLYREQGQTPPVVLDRLYPLYIWQSLPAGVAGLVMAAILAAAMSNLSAALNSLASTTVLDLWKPLLSVSKLGGGASDATWLARSRYATVAWGILLMAVALLARQWGSVLQAGLSIASIVYGSLLGVFLLGLFTRRVGEIAAMCGMSVGLVLLLYVRFATSIAFTWYVMIGASATFATAVLVSLIIKEPARGA
ncbi:MAG TPA: sodium:solute symporter [Bryobacteraceae bacterium]|nr:sodium:solute symporter [Bryobacteraceae bacterium]